MTCVLLLHGNGANGSTNFIDSAGRHGILPTGDTQIDTSQSVFGGSSIKFNAGSLVLDGSTDFNFGTEDFTIDMRVRFSVLDGAAQVLFDSRPVGVLTGNHPSIYLSATSDVPPSCFHWFMNNTDLINGQLTVSVDTWYHLGISRVLTQTKMLVNGIQDGATFTDTNNYAVGMPRPVIGNNGYILDHDPFRGWMQEIRILKGGGAYAGNFQVPTTQYSMTELSMQAAT